MPGTLEVTKDEFFPDSPRVFYERAPLKQVICQLRFPILYRIEREVPSDFQERIRAIFPLSERVEAFGTPFQIPKQLADVFGGAVGGATYKFLTEDRLTSIELGSTALTFETTAYRVWDEFLGILRPAIDSLVAIYNPSFYSRVGLRYIDLIDRVEIDLQDTPWSDLLNSVILGELGERYFEENTESIQKSIRVRNADKTGGFLLNHGLSAKPGVSNLTYSIDFDFYVDHKTETQDALAVLDALHARSGRAWRWSIKPKLHDALKPTAIDGDRMGRAVERSSG